VALQIKTSQNKAKKLKKAYSPFPSLSAKPFSSLKSGNGRSLTEVVAFLWQNFFWIERNQRLHGFRAISSNSSLRDTKKIITTFLIYELSLYLHFTDNLR